MMSAFAVVQLQYPGANTICTESHTAYLHSTVLLPEHQDDPADGATYHWWTNTDQRATTTTKTTTTTEASSDGDD